ncbi:RDD family protein [Helicobacter sp. 11S02629-2]|uniref:RDD family protein n=1 Tax=Helicobacter sp. 11S02629-2 TaxID=1476195 RepID=UPI000BA59611|nr:RDD family protein [Helicobacter sp. 11S02629-2]PAF45559.1 hypothetical protein BKH40_01365 [Helicobacter sp. 11S02629-2]
MKGKTSRLQKTLERNKTQKQSDSLAASRLSAYAFLRIKAFITDMFLIAMPILYIATYVILGGKDAFQASTPAHIICTLLFLIIEIIFFKVSGQTPGYRYTGLKLLSIKHGKKEDGTWKLPSIIQLVIFEIVYMIEMTLIFPLFYIKLRKDKRFLREVLSGTKVFHSPNLQQRKQK